MIAGVGIDIIDASRMQKWLGNKGLLKRAFHPDELEECLKKGKSAYLSLAARFAAKEAFGKALGAGLGGISLKDIAVLNNASGAPELTLCGTALNAFRESGAVRVNLSLSHEKNAACAVVILEK